jgi:hypothetical protein
VSPSGVLGPVDRAALAAYALAVAGGAGLVDAGITVNIVGRARLIDTGVSASLRVYVSSRAGLVDARVAMHVASRVRLVDARIATGIGGAVVSDFARLIDAAVACVQRGGGPGYCDSKGQCHGYELDRLHR